jgi:hypothetical protein
MNPPTLEQIAYLRKRIAKGDSRAEMLHKFTQRYQLGVKTFERRLRLARAGAGAAGSKPASLILLNFQHHLPQENDKNAPQDSTGAERKKEPVVPPQKKVAAGGGDILSNGILTLDECLLLLSRLAQGQCTVLRHVVCKGEVVEIEEQPNFSIRKAALNTLIKYHLANKAKSSAHPVLPTIPMRLQELLNVKSMSPERIRELMRQYDELNKQNKIPQSWSGK